MAVKPTQATYPQLDWGCLSTLASSLCGHAVVIALYLQERAGFLNYSEIPTSAFSAGVPSQEPCRIAAVMNPPRASAVGGPSGTSAA